LPKLRRPVEEIPVGLDYFKDRLTIFVVVPPYVSHPGPGFGDFCELRVPSRLSLMKLIRDVDLLP